MEDLPISPLKSIGLVIDGPALVYTIARKPYMLASTGKSFKVYSLPSLKIKFLGPTLEEPISCVEAFNESTFIATGNTLRRFHFHHVLAQKTFSSKILHILVIDKDILVALEDSTIHRLRSVDLEEQMNFLSNSPTHLLVHPATYLNKVLCAGKKSLALINCNSGKILFEFQNEEHLKKYFAHEVTAMVGSSAVDVIALGFSSGDVLLLNLKTAEIIISVNIGSSVQAFSFSQDVAVAPVLFISGSKHRVFQLDLNRQELELVDFTKNAIQYSFITSLMLENQELLIGASNDRNTIRVIKLRDKGESVFRTLRERIGPEGPISKIRLFDNRFFATLSQGFLYRMSLYNDAATLKITNESSSENSTEISMKRSLQDIKLCDGTLISPTLFGLPENSVLPIAFNFREAKQHKLLFERRSEVKFRDDPTYAKKFGQSRFCTAIELSVCGGYLFAGHEDGLLVKIAAASGEFQPEFISPAINEKIISIHCDSLNHYTVVVTQDKVYRLDFYSGKLISSEKVEAFLGRQDLVVKSFFERESEILVLVFTNSVGLVQSRTQKLHNLLPIEGQINDVTFLPGSMKMIWAESPGKMVFVDLIFGEVQFEYVLKKPVVSLAACEETRLLYTVEEGSRDINLWHLKQINKRLPNPVKCEFFSEIRNLPSSLRSFYFEKKQDPIHVEDHAMNEIAEAALKAVNDIDPLPFSQFSNTDPAKLRAIFYADQLTNNLLKDEEMDENKPELPFFLDFGEAEKLKKDFLDDILPKNLKSSEPNQLMDKHLSTAEQLLNQIDIDSEDTIESNYFELLKAFLDMSAPEVDYFLKKTAFFDEVNCMKMLKFLTFVIRRKMDVDITVIILANLMRSAIDLLLTRSEFTSKKLELLREIKSLFPEQLNTFVTKAKRLSSVCESISRDAFAE